MAEEPTKLDITDEMIAERRSSSGKMPSDMPKWMATTITKIDSFSKMGRKYCLLDYTIPLTISYDI